LPANRNRTARARGVRPGSEEFLLPQLVGPRAERFDLRFAGRDGTAFDSALLILVSNNPYAFDPRPQVRTRGTLDGGVLGVITVAGPTPHGLEEWSTPRFRVESATSVAVGIDGESVALSPPLLLQSDRIDAS
jgi:hypothetical protein